MKLKTPLNTERLILREFEGSDFDDVHLYASCEEVTKFVKWGPNSAVETRVFLENQLSRQNDPDRKDWEFAVVLKETGKVIGGCKLKVVEKNIGLLGYFLQKDLWGNGYGSEIAKVMMEWAFKEQGIEEMRATCDSRNTASRRILEKCGMKLVELRPYDLFIKGSWRDTLVFSTHGA